MLVSLIIHQVGFKSSTYNSPTVIIRMNYYKIHVIMFIRGYLFNYVNLWADDTLGASVTWGSIFLLNKKN